MDDMEEPSRTRGAVPARPLLAPRPDSSVAQLALHAEKYNPISVVVPGRHLLGGRPDDYTKVERVANSVVCLTAEPPSPGVLGLPVYWVPMWDTGERRELPDAKKLKEVLGLVAHLPRPVYWHCEQGINRSAFALAAYLILYRGQAPQAAIDHVRRCRSPDLRMGERDDGKPVCLMNSTMVYILQSLA